jgi:hypothetical protein
MIIGLCGPEGAGKSFAAKLLYAQFAKADAPHVYIHPFAAPLKRMLEALGVDPCHLYGTPAQKAEALMLFGGRSAREAMQTLGTEWGRNCVDQDIWVRAWQYGAPKGFKHLIADDLRFQNEARSIKLRSDGFIIKIIRSERDLDRKPRHASEDFNAIPHDVLIVNDKCPTILNQRLAEALNSFAVPA